ncbi:MAG: transposase [Shimia sp.]|nr:transposase [Shimia sp.]
MDESGFAHDMPRTHGYAPKGQRCHGSHDWHARGRTNVIGALIGSTLITACLFQCNIDSDVFQAWLTTDLIPKLPPGCVLVMDNATFHKRSDTAKAIMQANHTLQFMPSYSPDLNPIEHKWAQAKSVRRKTQCKIDELFENPKNWNQS